MPSFRVLRVFLSLAAVLVLVSAVRADTITIATFADPSPGSGTPLFKLDGVTFSGGWAASGLTLTTPNYGTTTWPDATFTMTDLVAVGGPLLYSLTGGEINFNDSSANLILKITFDSAQLYRPFVFGASDAVLNNVTFSGPIIPVPVHDEQFAFSLTNEVQTANGFTWTASFTSSAIPEPSTLGALALAGLALLRRR